MNNQLIFEYLSKKADELDEKIIKFEALVSEKDLAEAAYKKACEAVNDFGDIGAIEEERNLLSDMINGLKEPDEAQEVEPIIDNLEAPSDPILSATNLV